MSKLVDSSEVVGFTHNMILQGHQHEAPSKCICSKHIVRRIEWRSIIQMQLTCNQGPLHIYTDGNMERTLETRVLAIFNAGRLIGLGVGQYGDY